MATITHVRFTAGDWGGLYIDGFLVAENHCGRMWPTILGELEGRTIDEVERIRLTREQGDAVGPSLPGELVRVREVLDDD